MHLIKNKRIYYPRLSYRINGLIFKVHNELGRFRSERQYCDHFEKLLVENGIKYLREKELNKEFKGVEENGNIPDFVVEDRIIIDFKAKKFLTKEDYYQMRRYLEAANSPLGLLINFRSSYVKPRRILNPKFKS